MKRRLVPAALVGLLVAVVARLLTDGWSSAVILGLVALAAATLLPSAVPGGRRPFG